MRRASSDSIASSRTRDSLRTVFDPEALARLAASLERLGQLQPIRVRYDDATDRRDRHNAHENAAAHPREGRDGPRRLAGRGRLARRGGPARGRTRHQEHRTRFAARRGDDDTHDTNKRNVTCPRRACRWTAGAAARCGGAAVQRRGGGAVVVAAVGLAQLVAEHVAHPGRGVAEELRQGPHRLAVGVDPEAVLVPEDLEEESLDDVVGLGERLEAGVTAVQESAGRGASGGRG